MDKQYLTAHEVADILEISLPTVYSYVSRGLLSSEPVAGDHRIKRYRRRDVEQLLQRKEAQRRPEDFAKTTLHWGMPVLDSELTNIKQGRLFYRGYEAVELAKTVTLEEVAGLLWMDELDGRFFELDSRLQLPTELWQWRHMPAYTRMQLMMPLAATQDRTAEVLNPEQIPLTGVRIMRLLTGAVTFHIAHNATADNLASVWTPIEPGYRRALNAAMILCVDHGLNASSFAARIAAGAHATPYAVVSAGLATLAGKRHGRMSELVRQFITTSQQECDLHTVVEQRLDRGEAIPGFGHPLYPNGDPRAAMLIELATEINSQNTAHHRQLQQTVLQVTGLLPSLDWGLVMLSDALGLPEDAPLLLFALGRTVGWLGHALEQFESGGFIRPTANYVGRDGSVK